MFSIGEPIKVISTGNDIPRGSEGIVENICLSFDEYYFMVSVSFHGEMKYYFALRKNRVESLYGVWLYEMSGWEPEFFTAPCICVMRND